MSDSGIAAALSRAPIAFLFIMDRNFRGSVSIAAELCMALKHVLDQRGAKARRGPTFATP
jgi:hypothetical protein